MEDLITVTIITLILGAVILYLWRARKKGVKCVGCPDGAACSGKCGSCGGCSGCGNSKQ